jgi:RimJ/RimL family protein N-acetyltransferase
MLASSVPEIPGHAVSRITLSDADDWASFALLAQMQEHTSTSVSSVADLVPMIERSLSADPNAPILFAVRELTTGLLVGTVGFHTVSSLNKTAEVTYQVRPQCWGGGLATAMCNAAVHWAFQECGWVRVQGTTLEPHIASQRVLQKCGFDLEGRLRNFRMVRGQPRDYLLFSRVPMRTEGGAV